MFVFISESCALLSKENEMRQKKGILFKEKRIYYPGNLLEKYKA